ncbi:integrase [Alkanindiges hydrocarboniclasticus]|uniref:Integrase n=1 Tax=Alkanindiges hydrocarboniclasticus TaxID=1907941 RepID=A0A1S8CQP3_9GAMM|nr:site-specific integrase [Alkanindiges hydrocarboniclasticus]ONG37605.1 integrase [Alkanindiges hydrocarboniclasticus]
MNQKLHLTAELIPTLCCPATKRDIEFTDDVVKGLKLVITRGGRYSWLLRYIIGTKKRAMKLGDYPSVTLAQVRLMAQAHHELIKHGTDPQEQRDMEKTMPLLTSFFMDHYYPYAQKRKSSYLDDLSRFNNHLKAPLGHLKLNQVDRTAIIQVLDHVKNLGLSNATVNRIRALCSSVMNYAIDLGLLDRNPVQRVKKYKESHMIERYLSEIELVNLMKVLNAPDAFGITNLVIVSIVKMLLLTGMRKREVMDIKWRDIDLKTGHWKLEKNKSGKPRLIYLSGDALVEIKKMLPQRTEHVFANLQTGSPFNDIRKTFDKIMKAARIDNIRIHDLRHNFASMAVNQGLSLYVVQNLLGHASPQTTQRYAHLKGSVLTDAYDQVASLINQAAKIVPETSI